MTFQSWKPLCYSYALLNELPHTTLPSGSFSGLAPRARFFVRVWVGGGGRGILKYSTFGRPKNIQLVIWAEEGNKCMNARQHDENDRIWRAREEFQLKPKCRKGSIEVGSIWSVAYCEQLCNKELSDDSWMSQKVKMHSFPATFSTFAVSIRIFSVVYFVCAYGFVMLHPVLLVSLRGNASPTPYTVELLEKMKFFTSYFLHSWNKLICYVMGMHKTIEESTSFFQNLFPLFSSW